jgi:hypothetical protein
LAGKETDKQTDIPKNEENGEIKLESDKDLVEIKLFFMLRILQKM